CEGVRPRYDRLHLGPQWPSGDRQRPDEDRGQQQKETQHTDHASFCERSEIIVVRLLDEWSLCVCQPRLGGARAFSKKSSLVVEANALMEQQAAILDAAGAAPDPIPDDLKPTRLSATLYALKGDMRCDREC